MTDRDKAFAIEGCVRTSARAERADTPVRPLARREQHHGDVAFRSGLVVVIVGPLGCHDRPHALLFFGRRSPRPDRNHFVPHLDLHIGVGEQVFVPPRMVGRATFRSDNQIVVAVAPVNQREFFRVCGELLISPESAIRQSHPNCKGSPKHKLAYNRTMLPKMHASPSTTALSTTL